MFNQYVDFEVHVSPLSASRYAVAVSGPGGDASGALLLPTDDPIFQALAARLAALDTDEETLVELGKMLFGALFQGAITSQGINLVRNPAGASGLKSNDLVNVDPLLGRLQDNGGPTFTSAPAIGSPAIDAGDTATCAKSAPPTPTTG